MKLVIICLLLVAEIYAQDKLKISVYYETLCPDSIRFFRYQFGPTYRQFLPYLKVDFVPYGKAKHVWQEAQGTWNIQCQHGQKECVGNRFHACALAQGNGHEKDVQFISCSMSSANPTSLLLLMQCAKETGIDFQAIENCFEDRPQSLELLVKYGERTKALVPKLRYVPTIVFNDVYDAATQRKAETNLKQAICDNLNPKPVGLC